MTETAEKIEREELDIQVHRLTKPTTLSRFAPQVHGLVQHIGTPEIRYEGLYMYLLGTVQQGEYLLPKGIKPLKEFTLVTINGIPVGFAHWLVKQMPLYVATAHMDFIYVWAEENGDEALQALVNRFIAFGRRNNCQYYQTDYYWQPNMNEIEKMFEAKNLTFKEKEVTTFFAKEKNLK